MPTSSEAVVALPAEVALHARPAGIFVRKAMTFAARITIEAGDKQADAKSILAVLALGATGGSTVVLRAHGADASEALTRLADCLRNLA
jgi:phosphocarrier protein HPr